MDSLSVFVIDDDKMERELFKEILEEFDCEVNTFPTGNEGVKALQQEYADLVITDYRMPGIDGLETIKKVKEINPEIDVIMVTGHGSIEAAVEAMKMGARDFITKPVDMNELKFRVNNIKEHKVLINENEILKERIQSITPDTNIIYRSQKMQKVINLIGKVSKSKSSVLIEGETGTGKDLVAKSIHNLSDRREGPFVAVNCAAIPENLFESELFGHEKGTFTGASKRQKGKFEIANHGTLFMDEIGEIPLKFQVKLLRVLQEKEFQRLGSSQNIKTDLQILSATNRDIQKLVDEGQFRSDLLFRLNVITIHVAPLRERKEDIPALVEHFIQKHSENTAMKVDGISSQALDLLMKYDFPGNVRELENIIERALLLTRKDIITSDDLPLTDSHGDKEMDLTDRVENYEKGLIRNALEKTNNVKRQAARELGISESTLRYKIKKYFDE